ncbi:MAG: cyclic nucleotide-binding domain-containing protein [Myxococcota bacterium]
MAVPSQALEACKLLRHFTPTGLEILGQIARRRTVPQGMSVFLAGTSGDGLVIIEAGAVEIVAGGGEEGAVLYQLGPGDHFGELALIRPGRRAVTARAQGACKLIEIKRADFNLLLKKKPQTCVKLLLAVLNTVGDRLDAIRDDLLTQI